MFSAHPDEHQEVGKHIGELDDANRGMRQPEIGDKAQELRRIEVLSLTPLFD